MIKGKISITMLEYEKKAQFFFIDNDTGEDFYLLNLSTCARAQNSYRTMYDSSDSKYFSPSKRKDIYNGEENIPLSKLHEFPSIYTK